MINRIEIDIPNWKAIIVDGESIINDKIINLNNKNIQDIVRIIRNWNNEYKDNYELNIHSIRVITDDFEEVYRFYNKYPNNFINLIKYLEELYDRK